MGEINNITVVEMLREEGTTSDQHDLNEWGHTCAAMILTEKRKTEKLIKKEKISKYELGTETRPYEEGFSSNLRVEREGE